MPFAKKMIRHLYRGQNKRDATDTKAGKKGTLLSLAIVVFYYALPIVSRSIFDAKKCRAFQENEEEDFKSYLLADMSIECSESSDTDYGEILGLFWFFFVLWPILIPFIFLLLLKKVKKSVQESRPSSLAIACRFLWEDYNESMMFWDIVDSMRKNSLTCFVMFFDPEEGSNKLFRLVLASMISSIYLGFLAIARPYKHNDDFYLAFLSNVVLICCFIMSIILQLCNKDKETCNELVGMSLNDFSASVVVVLLAIGTIIVTIASLVKVAFNTISAQSVRVISTGWAPVVEMPKCCKYHIFMSHLWATGQAKTHAISRKLQLSLPTLKVWLE